MSRESFQSRSTYEHRVNEAKTQYVLFSLGEDVFGVLVNQVDSVQTYTKSYRVPGTPNYVLGVTNARGKVVTLVHLGRRLGISETTPTEDNHVIYVEKNQTTLGMVVDKVLHLEEIPDSLIKTDLDMINTDINIEFLKGAATLENSIVILLNLDLVLSDYEVEEIGRRHSKAEEKLKASEVSEVDDDTFASLDLAGDYVTTSDSSLDDDDEDDEDDEYGSLGL